MKRVGPPPLFAGPGYYCNHPQLTVAIPTNHAPTGLQCAFVSAPDPSSVNSKQYLVDVPFGAVPGDLIRVLISGEEFLVKCPKISCTGEQILVSFTAQ